MLPQRARPRTTVFAVKVMDGGFDVQRSAATAVPQRVLDGGAAKPAAAWQRTDCRTPMQCESRPLSGRRR